MVLSIFCINVFLIRFVIHKNVRRDLIPELPLPRRMIDYLNTPHYYSERFVDLPEMPEYRPPSSGENTLSCSFVPPLPSNVSTFKQLRFKLLQNMEFFKGRRWYRSFCYRRRLGGKRRDRQQPEPVPHCTC